jgi:hypothetical protein
MKKLLSILLLFFALQVMAQGNLQFNQVINIKNGDTYTVPVDKVLKITAVSSGSNNVISMPLLRCDLLDGQNYCAYDLNATIGYIGNLNFNLNYNQSNYPNGVLYSGPFSQCQCPTRYEYKNGNTINIPVPFWLKTGQNISINPGNGILISAIEFNIVP